LSSCCLFQVSSTALGIRGWTGCVIGQNLESYGVILFDSIAAYERCVQLAEYAEREGARPSDGFPHQREINYEARAAMPASLLKEIGRHHWPVAKGAGYPTVLLIGPDLALAPPTRADLPHHWQDPQVLRKRYRVSVQGEERVGDDRYGLRCPAPAEPRAE
jgi:hypothetical protein